MSAWDNYQIRINASGGSIREAVKRREKRFLNTKRVNNLSYFEVLIDGSTRYVSIKNRDNLNEKTIYSMPNEFLDCGSIVFWMDNYWLISELDANSEIYSKATMVQCNYLLKWIDDEDQIIEQWCAISDGTKYLTGEYEDRSYVVTRGDSRLSVLVPRNEHTVKLDRGNRFLIDDEDKLIKTAYSLTKPLMVGSVYNQKGIFAFVMQEVVSTDDDNHELGIADYYKHFRRENGEESTSSSSQSGRLWI